MPSGNTSRPADPRMNAGARTLTCAMIIAAPLVLSCSSQPSQAPTDVEALQELKTVSVAADVSAPPFLYYFGPTESAAGLLFGAVSTAGTQVSAEKVGRRLDATLAEHGTSIQKIVRESLVQQIGATAKPARLVESNGDAEFRLDILFYGLAGKNRLSSELVPTLRVHNVLTDRSGKVIGEKTLHADTKDPSQAPKPVEVFFSDPGELEAAYRNASRLIFEKMLDDFSR